MDSNQILALFQKAKLFAIKSPKHVVNITNYDLANFSTSDKTYLVLQVKDPLSEGRYVPSAGIFIYTFDDFKLENNCVYGYIRIPKYN